MKILRTLIDNLLEAEIVEIRIGLYWAAVVAKVGRDYRCGLASMLHEEHTETATAPAVPEELFEVMSGRELAAKVFSTEPLLRSVGMAAINAMVKWDPASWKERNVEDLIAEIGHGKRVAVVGRFPFLPRLRQRVGELYVIEQNPQPMEYPAEEATRILSQVDAAAITSMTFINQTLESLLEACRPDTQIILAGPSTPLCADLFEFGIDYLSGAVVENQEAVLRGISEGATFRQLHQFGIRLVTLQK